ncbi:unnamed protein product [Linum trigynum]|uniref:Late embryogenesis abundant protein Lea5 n=1 Tax=Linum trigynum TaxID=586398 RepID=A0AAV2FG58_9ROSI
MSRSVAAAKLLPVSFSVLRRGYAASAAAPLGAASAALGRVPAGNMVGKAVEERSPAAVVKEDSGAASAWGPDPVTGYYRPGNSAAEIDPVELREMLLNNRVRPN